MTRKDLRLDDGYQFGIGVFETIAVEQNIPLLLEEHLQRMEQSMHFLGIEWKRQGLLAADTAGGRDEGAELQSRRGQMQEDLAGQIRQYLEMHPLGHGALKLLVSEENTVLTHRPNPYTAARYEKGFRMDYSHILRNETSPFVFHKTLNYGDCILEKRNAAAKGLDELVFLNTKGQLCEGTTTNLFFVKKGKLYTPEKACGLLPGIMRDWVMRRKVVEETVILPEQIEAFDECFVTNSLMGVMPAVCLGKHEFGKRDMADCLLERWQEEIGAAKIGPRPLPHAFYTAQR